jgi:hypothetical protein
MNLVPELHKTEDLAESTVEEDAVRCVDVFGNEVGPRQISAPSEDSFSGLVLVWWLHEEIGQLETSRESRKRTRGAKGCCRSGCRVS